MRPAHPDGAVALRSAGPRASIHGRRARCCVRLLRIALCLRRTGARGVLLLPTPGSSRPARPTPSRTGATARTGSSRASRRARRASQSPGSTFYRSGSRRKARASRSQSSTRVWIRARATSQRTSWRAGTSSTRPPTRRTEAAHGTLLASVIAAAAGNGSYVGIAPRATILPVKIMGGRGGQWSSRAPAAAVRYAIDHGARVLNCSWGSLNIGPIPGMANALAAAVEADALVVFSGTKESTSRTPTGTSNSPTPKRTDCRTPSPSRTSEFGHARPDSNYGARHVQLRRSATSCGATTRTQQAADPSEGRRPPPRPSPASPLSCSPPTRWRLRPRVRRAILSAPTEGDPTSGKRTRLGGCSRPRAHSPRSRIRTPQRRCPSARSVRQSAFDCRGAAPVTLRWSPSRDSELEGYKVTFAGRTFIVPPTRTQIRRALAGGTYNWSVWAYDLSDNETTARPIAQSRH